MGLWVSLGTFGHYRVYRVTGQAQIGSRKVASHLNMNNSKAAPPQAWTIVLIAYRNLFQSVPPVSDTTSRDTILTLVSLVTATALTLVAVREEESPSRLAVERDEVIHDHSWILRDAAAEHTHLSLVMADRLDPSKGQVLR